MTKLSKKRRLKRARAHANRLDRRTGVLRKRQQAKTLFNKLHFESKRAADVVIIDDPVDAQQAAKNLVELQQEYNAASLAESDAISREADIAFPTRAACPSCGYSQKVRKDGKMSRHDVFHGANPTQCPGSGQFWKAS